MLPLSHTDSQLLKLLSASDIWSSRLVKHPNIETGDAKIEYLMAQSARFQGRSIDLDQKYGYGGCIEIPRFIQPFTIDIFFSVLTPQDNSVFTGGIIYGAQSIPFLSRQWQTIINNSFMLVLIVISIAHLSTIKSH